MKDFIKRLAKRARYTEKDIKIIMDTFIEMLEEISEKGESVTLHGLGKLYTQKIPPRKSSEGKDLPEANRVVFKLSENIRYAHKRKQKTES